MNVPISNKAAAAAPAFVLAMSTAAARADNANLAAAANVLVILRNAGGTNKKAASALWALLPDDVVNTFQQVKRVSGALNAPADNANDNAKMVRTLWLGAKTQTAFVKSLLDIGITSPRAMLDFVAPRKEPKTPVVKSAVEAFLTAAKTEGFKEDVTDLLGWVVERHAVQMAGLLKQAQAFQAGVLKDAAEKQADIEAKAEKAKAAKAAKAARDAERSRIHAERLAQAEKLASAEKSAAARKAHAEKVVRERALRNREIIEA